MKKNWFEVIMAGNQGQFVINLFLSKVDLIWDTKKSLKENSLSSADIREMYELHEDGTKQKVNESLISNIQST